MTVPSLPAGFDHTRHVQAGRPDCHITVGFDQTSGHIPRFLIQFHYQAAHDPVRWETIARMDHNETAATGHNVYREGLHVDVARRSSPEVHLRLSHGPLPQNRGTVIRGCVGYFRDETAYFIDVYEERHPPGGAPSWTPDGGKRTPRFMRPGEVGSDMSRESRRNGSDSLEPEELSELLAEATNTTAEEIEAGAEELEIAPPSEATVVEE